MAAVIPHLEQQDDPSETATERKYFQIRRKHALGLTADRRYELAREAVQTAHAELISTVWTRRALEEVLASRTITVTTKGRDVILQLDGPIGQTPRFNPPGDGSMSATTLLSWTSKMACPSFSLPAGPTIFGGSCLGALGGQSIVPEPQLHAAAQRVTAITGEPVVLADCVCQWCYAVGGNYRYGTKQLAQVIIYAWARQALRDGSFVEVLDWAIKHAKYDIRELPAERHRARFFRLHDSGDFFSLDYLAAWKQLTRLNPDIVFWAPTRIWATGRGIEAVNEINTPADNFIIRPSGYMVDRPQGPPLGPGWAAWSVVYDVKNKPPGGPEHREGPYNWDCQAYAVEKEAHTCRNALAPDGQTGCRTCWIHPQLAVNYTKH